MLQVINLCANDGDRLLYLCRDSVAVTGMVGCICGVVYSMYLLGPWGLLGFFVFFLFFPIQVCVIIIYIITIISIIIFSLCITFLLYIVLSCFPYSMCACFY